MRDKGGKFFKGQETWNKGRKCPEFSGLKHGRWKGGKPKCIDCGKQLTNYSAQRCKKHYGISIRGERHYNYIKDRSKLKEPRNRSDTLYIEWRKQVWGRDKFKCKMGNLECHGGIEAHHILRWSEFPNLRYEVNNGITLCHFHHPRKIKDEMKLSPYFQELVKVKSK